MPLLVAGCPEAQGQGDFAGGDHANGHGFAVQIGAVAAEGFHHMAEGVAVVEDRPQAALVLIGRHHLGLGRRRAQQDGLEEVGAQPLQARKGAGTFKGRK